MGSSATENGIPMLHHGLSIPELVKFIRYSFLERDYNEVQSIFMGREKKQYMEMENLRRERDSIKEEAERNQGLAELEKLKLKRYERRCQKLKETVRMLTVEQMPFSNRLKLKRENDCDYDNVYEEQPKMASDKNESIVELNEKINELKKQNLESEELVRIYQEKLRSADMKLVEMEQVITDLRQEKSTVNETLEQLRKRQIESDEVVEMLRCKNVEAAKCVDELRAEKMKSDKRSEYYKGWYLKLEGRVMDMERMLSNMLKVNIKDLANVANTIDNASASADGGNVELPDCFRSGKDSLENDKVNVDDFEDVVMSPSLPFLTNSTGSGAVGLPNKGGSNLAQAWKNEDKTNKGEEPHFSDIIEICDSDDETNTGYGDLITKKRKRSLVKSDEDNVATVTELTNTSLRHHDADSGGSNLVQSWKNEDNTNKGEEPRISDIIEICDSDDETNAGYGDLITKKRKRSLVKSEEYKIATFTELTNTSLCHHVVDSDQAWKRAIPTLSLSARPSLGSDRRPSHPEEVRPAPGSFDAPRSGTDKGKRTLVSSEPLPEARCPRLRSSPRDRPRANRVRASANDSFTLELPKSILELSADEARHFLKLIVTSADNLLLSQQSLDSELAMGAHHMTKAAVYFSKLQARVAASHQVETSRALAEKEAELEEMKQKLAALEKNHAKRVSELQQEVNLQKKRVADEKAKSRLYGEKKYAEGVEACRQNLLLSEAGQAFLKELVVGLKEAYLKSSCSLADFGPNIGHYYAFGFNSARQQAEEQGFSGDFDINGPLADLPASPYFQGDPFEDIEAPWWLPVLQQAYANLHSARVDLKALPSSDLLTYPLLPDKAPALLPRLHTDVSGNEVDLIVVREDSPNLVSTLLAEDANPPQMPLLEGVPPQSSEGVETPAAPQVGSSADPSSALLEGQADSTTADS